MYLLNHQSIDSSHLQIKVTSRDTNEVRSAELNVFIALTKKVEKVC